MRIAVMTGRTTRAMAVPLALIAFSCSAPTGVDPTRDAAAPADAAADAPMVGPDDTLTLGEAAVRIGPDLLRCLVPAILHRDGTSDPLDPVQVRLETNDPAVAVPAEPSDCATGVGLIGVGPGTTTVTARLTSGAVTVRVGVTSVAMSIGLQLADQLVVRGGEVPYDACSGPCPAVTVTDAQGQRYPQLHLVPRLLTLSTSDPSIAVVTRNDSSRTFSIRALAPGTTMVEARYGSSGRERTARATIRVPSDGTLRGIARVDLVSPDGAASVSATVLLQQTSQAFSAGHLQPGQCFTPRVLGDFVDGAMNVWQSPLPDATVTPLDGFRPDTTDPHRVCAPDGIGEGSLRVCLADGRCATGYWAVMPRGTTVEANPARISASGVSVSNFCPSLRVTAVAPDGARRDITSLLSWVAVGRSVGDLSLTLQRTFRGMPPAGVDGAGNPCFSVMSTTVASGHVAGQLTAQFGDVSAGSSVELDLAMVRP